MEILTTLPQVLIRTDLAEISRILGVPMGGVNIEINGLNLCNRSIIAENALSYCTSPKYLKVAEQNPRVKALIVTPEIYDSLDEKQRNHISYIVSTQPEATFYQLFEILQNKGCYPKYDWKTDLSGAIVSKGAVVENGVILGKNCKIGCNSVICSGTIIGDNVTIGNCSVIGSNGFQLIRDAEGKNMVINHVGRTYIGNNVTIADNVTIDRSLFESYTFVNDYVKIDNHVHVAHNCMIGENSVLTAGAILFGSSEIGKDVWVAPGSSIMNRVKIGDGAMVCASTFVMRNVKPYTKVFGIPAVAID